MHDLISVYVLVAASIFCIASAVIFRIRDAKNVLGMAGTGFY